MSEISVTPRAVPAVPFYMSQANQEFLGTTVGNISASMYAAGVPVPGSVSALAGKSAGSALTVGTFTSYDENEGFPIYSYGYSLSKMGALVPTTLPDTGIEITAITGGKSDYFGSVSYSTCSISLLTPLNTGYIKVTVNGVTYIFVKYYSDGRTYYCPDSNGGRALSQYLESMVGQVITVGLSHYDPIATAVDSHVLTSGYVVEYPDPEYPDEYAGWAPSLAIGAMSPTTIPGSAQSMTAFYANMYNGWESHGMGVTGDPGVWIEVMHPNGVYLSVVPSYNYAGVFQGMTSRYVPSFGLLAYYIANQGIPMSLKMATVVAIPPGGSPVSMVDLTKQLIAEGRIAVADTLEKIPPVAVAAKKELPSPSLGVDDIPL